MYIYWYSSVDCNPPVDVKSVFLDMSKALDRVWHDGPVHKIKCVGINSTVHKLRKEQTSSQEWVLAGVP